MPVDAPRSRTVPWSDTGVPLARRGNYKAAETARLNGCRPQWWHLYKQYVCTCTGNRHGCDQQLSVISAHSARRLPLQMRPVSRPPRAKRQPAALVPEPTFTRRIER